MTPLTQHPRPASGRYGPTKKQHYYESVTYHRRNAAPSPHKTRWVIAEGEEYAVFLLADDGWWYCKEGQCLFAVVNGGELELGEGGERLATFIPPKNQLDSYHGHPVASDVAKPEPDLLDQWEQGGVIDYSVRIKIERGRL